MADPDVDIKFNSPTDRLIGMLIERTEAGREDSRRLQDAIHELTKQTTRLSGVIDQLVPRMIAVEARPSPEDRLSQCEECCKDWRKWKMAILTGLAAIGLIALFSGLAVLSNLRPIAEISLP